MKWEEASCQDSFCPTTMPLAAPARKSLTSSYHHVAAAAAAANSATATATAAASEASAKDELEGKASN